MLYRNFRKLDPFQQVRRNIELRLAELEEAILSQYQPGQKRRVVQRAIRQLLKTETTTQGKIKKLITITQSLNINDDFFFNELDDGTYDLKKIGSQPSNFNIEREKLFQRYRIQKQINESTQYSTVSCKNDKTMAKQELSQKSNYQKKMQIRPHLTHSQSVNSQLHKKNPIKIQKEQCFSGYSEQQSSRQSGVCQYKSIEKDLFSFRTSNNDNEKSRHLSKSNQLKKSKNTIQQPLNKAKDRQNKRQINKQKYDGYSECFGTNQSRFSFQPNSDKNVKQQLQIYKKINNRIRVSACVVGKVEHGSASDNTSNLLNKCKLQKDGRGDLIQDIVNAHYSLTVWK